MVIVASGSVCAVSLLLWLAGQLSALLAGHGWGHSPPLGIRGILSLARDRTGKLAIWRSMVGPTAGPTWLVLTVLAILLLPVLYVAYWLVRLYLNWRRRREFRLFRLGFASGREIRDMLGARAVLKKAPSVRPSFKSYRKAKPREVGFYLGRDIRSRQELFASVEDVFIILAPPRQGKDVHFCTPFTIDAPGPCIVTSTRSDAFSNTYGSRAKMGRVHVFDPNGLTSWPERLRWSPVLGCEDPLIAANRASAFVAGAGFELGGDGAIFISSATTILRCYLHAASLEGLTIRDIARWSTQPTNPEAGKILRIHEAKGSSALGWAGELEALAAAEPRFRGLVWANVVQVLGCFSDPSVMDACSPRSSEMFDLSAFLSGRNTLYILGKEKKNASIAPVITAMMESIFDETRKIAARMPGSRLDPPLTVELNEVAHIAPLPNLPAYMGDSGGFSIALHIYLQSLSQARSRWGEHEAMIMWDNAAVRIIMGGSGNVADLEDVSRLMGEIPADRRTSGTERTRRVLSPEEIRTLKFGTAVVIARSVRPVEVHLTPWWKRKDGKEIAAGKAATERMILRYTDGAHISLGEG